MISIFSKYTFAFFFFTFFIYNTCTAQWIAAPAAPFINGRSVQYTSPQTIYVGSGHGVSKSIDGGTSWTSSDQFNDALGKAQDLPFYFLHIIAIHFFDDQHGIAVGADYDSKEIILKTSDGGLTWAFKFIGGQDFEFGSGIRAISFPTVALGYVASFSGHIYKTTDAGETWAPLNSGTTNKIIGIQFFDANNGVALSTKEMLKTNDGGAHWSLTSLGFPFYDATAFHFTTVGDGFYADSQGQFFQTHNAGATWSAYPFHAFINNFHMIDASTIWAAGDGLFKTSDGGVNWFLQKRPDANMEFEDVAFYNQAVGIALSSNQDFVKDVELVYRTNNGGAQLQAAVSFTNAPASASPREQITLTGTNFDYVNNVIISDISAPFFRTGTTSIAVAVPDDAKTTKKIELRVQAGSVFSPDVLSISNAPDILYYTPGEGVVGMMVELNGINLGDASGVAFNGVPAVYTVISNTKLQATVPEGATTGSIVVTTPHGSVSKPFTIFPTPEITTFFPKRGPRNIKIHLYGNNLSSEFSRVSLNGTNLAPFTYSTGDFQFLNLPAEASTGKFSITTRFGRTVYSSESFIVEEGHGTVSVSGFSPGSGTPGDVITVKGNNFYAIQDASMQFLKMRYEVLSDTVLLATVPEIRSSSPLSFLFTDAITREPVYTQTDNFVYIPGESIPTIESISSTTASVGDFIIVKGKNLEGVEIFIGDIEVTNITQLHLNEFRVQVPELAVTGSVKLVHEQYDRYDPNIWFTVIPKLCAPGVEVHASTHVGTLRVGDSYYTNPILSGYEPNYHDFTNQVITVNSGEGIPLEITPGLNTTGDRFISTVYIDWNNDLDFNDMGERIQTEFQSGAIRTVIPVMKISRPLSTHMRILVNASSPCAIVIGLPDAVAYDYSLQIEPDSSATDPVFVAYYPDKVTWGSALLVSGYNLDKVTEFDFDGFPAEFSYDPRTPLQLLVTVPDHIYFGNINLKTPDGKFLYFPTVYIVQPPTNIQFSPATDTVGATIRLAFESYQTRASIEHVYFDNVEAKFYSGDGVVWAKIPAGAKQGKICVRNLYGLFCTSEDFTPLAAPGPMLIAPSNLSGFATASAFVTLSWKDNSNTESKFYIEYAYPAGSGNLIRLDSTNANATEITVTTPHCSETASFRVVAYNRSLGNSASGVIDITSFPVVPVISGRNVICDAEPTTLTATGYTSYHWSTGSENQSIVITTPGRYSVAVHDYLGCPGEGSVTITQGISPLALITVNGNTLTSSPGDSYTWFRNGEVLSSGTQEIEASLSGEYQVRVDKGQCSTLSSKVVVVVTGLEDSLYLPLTIFPNPTPGKFNVHTNGLTGSIVVINSLGTIIKQIEPDAGGKDIAIDLAEFPTGLYLISAPAGEKVKSTRVMLVR